MSHGSLDVDIQMFSTSRFQRNDLLEATFDEELLGTPSRTKRDVIVLKMMFFPRHSLDSTTSKITRNELFEIQHKYEIFLMLVL